MCPTNGGSNMLCSSLSKGWAMKRMFVRWDQDWRKDRKDHHCNYSFPDPIPLESVFQVDPVFVVHISLP